MNYELAKELNEAGFPNEYLGFHDPHGWPTLTELIEACGDRFHMLTRRDERIDDETAIWMAYEHDSENALGEGKTPEEAVARLWLKLGGK